MNLRPLPDRMLIRRLDEVSSKRVDGSVIPDTLKEKPQQGDVLSIEERSL